MPQENESSAVSSLTRRTFLGASAVTVAGLALSACSSTESSAAANGVFRVGVPGAGTQATLNPLIVLGEAAFAASQSMFERLADFDAQSNLYNSLAEEFSHDTSGETWKIKLRSGVTWHDGSDFTADDVVYTLRYQLDKANKTDGYANLSPYLTANNIRRVDAQTVELKLNQPYALLPEILASKEMYIIKNGTTRFDHPIGTGPFKFKSFKAGQRTTLVRNSHYHQDHLPYLDQLEINEINDIGARMNALIGGQIDALSQLDPSQVKQTESTKSLAVLKSPGGGTTDQFMMVNKTPFSDVRVRQAFRLMIDREQLVATALQGHGRLGNDLFCINDPAYNSSLPQREHDPDQARSLLKQAGYENLTVPLYTASAGPGMLSSATLIAEQAKAAGVNIKLQQVPASEYYSGRSFKNVGFECSQWGQHTLDSQFSQAFARDAYWNEPGWWDQRFGDLVSEGRKTFDEAARKDKFAEAQKIIWDEGAYIIWGFADVLDAHSAKVNGLVASGQRNLGYYRFEKVRVG